MDSPITTNPQRFLLHSIPSSFFISANQKILKLFSSLESKKLPHQVTLDKEKRIKVNKIWSANFNLSVHSFILFSLLAIQKVKRNKRTESKTKLFFV